MSDDEPKRSKVKHQIGDSLDYMSVEELENTVEMLRTEIERIETAIGLKNTGRNVADSFFKI